MNYSNGLKADGQTSSADLRSRQIDDLVPRELTRPKSVEEISSALERAERESKAVSPWGSGSKVQLGDKLKALDIVLETTALNRVIEYEPADLTVTVHAGITLRELQNHLAKRGQFLPLNPPFASKTTMGGIVATNSSGPRQRVAYGSVRDLLLGLRFVLPNGVIAKTGGKVVKNVSGYDMKKLFIGSLGTLGVIAEASFKVLPLPEQEKTLIASFRDADSAWRTASQLLSSGLLPEVVELVAPNFGEISGCTEFPDCVSLVVSFCGLREDVERQMRQFEELCKKVESSTSILDGKSQDRSLEAIQEFPALRVEGLSALSKSSVVVSKLPEMMKAIDVTAGELGLQRAYSAHAGTGVAHTWFFSDKVDARVKDALTQAMQRLREISHKFAGTHSVMLCPVWLKSNFHALDIPAEESRLMEAIRAKFDPKGILNPGKLVAVRKN